MATAQSPRLLTPAEIGACIRQFRQLRHWSQEQLAQISGLNVRTIQRVEQGETASFDTRRALARAFDLNDIDALNKPFSLPSDEELKSAQDQFERDHMTLAVAPVTTGRQLAGLVTLCEMDLSEPAFELPRDAATEFALLIDYYREYRDCHDLYSEADKLDIYDELQQHIDALRLLGVSLSYGQRKLTLQLGSGAPMNATCLYIVAFRLGHDVSQIVTPKAARIG